MICDPNSDRTKKDLKVALTFIRRNHDIKSPKIMEGKK
jgi:hypothetical protein